MNIIDVAAMPGFDASAINRDVSAGQTGGQRRADGTVVNAKVIRVAEDTTRSVTRDRIYFGLPASGGGIPTVCCRDHGAVLCVAKNPAGAIWRCPACNEGAFVPEVPE